MKTHLLLLSALLFTTAANAVTYRYVDEALVVDSLLERIDKNAVVIDEEDYQKSGKGLFEVELADDSKVPDVVYLKKTIQWLHQSPAPGEATQEANVGTLTLTSKSGNGLVEIDNGSGWQELTSQTIPTGASIRTAEGVSVNFSAPGVAGLHLDEKSEIQFIQKKISSGISSQIGITKGTSFIKTLKLKSGITHDFKIVTPISIAAARGTEYLVSHDDGVSVTCIVQGGVDVARTDGESVAELTVERPGDLLFQAVPELSAKQYSEWLYDMIVRIRAKNAADTTARTFTGYLPVVRQDSHLKSFWEATDGGRIKW
ncbi:MAG: FecR domain-containing protein [Verrucomicrobiota bacterium]